MRLCLSRIPGHIRTRASGHQNKSASSSGGQVQLTPDRRHFHARLWRSNRHGSFVPQGFGRVHPHRPARGNVACGERRADQDQGHRHERQRIEHAHIK